MFTEQEQRMTIDFEKDQEQVINKTENISKLADKIQEMQAVQKALEMDEEQIDSVDMSWIRWKNNRDAHGKWNQNAAL